MTLRIALITDLPEFVAEVHALVAGGRDGGLDEDDTAEALEEIANQLYLAALDPELRLGRNEEVDL